MKRKINTIELSKKKLSKLENLIQEIQDNSDNYLNFENIIRDFTESLNNNIEGMINRCVECNIDMGRSNPRQLCGRHFVVLKKIENKRYTIINKLFNGTKQTNFYHN